MVKSELKSKERKLNRQLEVIRKALSDTGCEELPNGCDLDNSFEQSGENNDIQVRKYVYVIVVNVDKIMTRFYLFS